MKSEIEQALEMRKEKLHLLEMKNLLSKRKGKDGSSSYKRTLDRIEEAEKKMMSPNKE